jgi:hypothetical protein
MYIPSVLIELGSLLRRIESEAFCSQSRGQSACLWMRSPLQRMLSLIPAKLYESEALL